VKRVAIAGGIGAGKTALAEHLTSRGWPVVDADLVARRVVEPGEPAWRALRDAFGTAVLAGDNEIDRAFLADIVFRDATALRRLNHITHGYIAEEIMRQIAATSADVVFIALPLYRDEHRNQLGLDEVWAVEVDPEVAVARLIESRGFSEADARARLAVQMSNEARRALADRVISNEGTREELTVKVDEALRALGVA
jgi:dephospho-CoA kinase